jgi:hypothetical protein
VLCSIRWAVSGDLWVYGCVVYWCCDCVRQSFVVTFQVPIVVLRIVVKLSFASEGVCARGLMFPSRLWHCTMCRAALRVGLAVSRVRILGSVLKSDSAPKQALASVSRGAWHCIAQPFENAVNRSAKPPGRPILKPVPDHFLISGLTPTS